VVRLADVPEVEREPERKRHLGRLWLHLHRGRPLAPDFDNHGGIVTTEAVRNDGLRV